MSDIIKFLKYKIKSMFDFRTLITYKLFRYFTFGFLLIAFLKKDLLAMLLIALIYYLVFLYKEYKDGKWKSEIKPEIKVIENEKTNTKQ
ncbi:MAG: hypothetical protein QW469_01155 [Candidatus Aenigmatarchaeota archaeon]